MNLWTFLSKYDRLEVQKFRPSFPYYSRYKYVTVLGESFEMHYIINSVVASIELRRKKLANTKL